MARFYDCVNNSGLKRVEGLLKKRGVVYTLSVSGNGTSRIKEIQVAEEDLAEAEKILYGTSYPNN